MDTSESMDSPCSKDGFNWIRVAQARASQSSDSALRSSDGLITYRHRNYHDAQILNKLVPKPKTSIFPCALIF